MNEQYAERKIKALQDLKQFAKSEMARDLAQRHGKSLRLPWDAEQAETAPQTQELDSESLEALAGMAGGD